MLEEGERPRDSSSGREDERPRRALLVLYEGVEGVLVS
jgi:hypothetical protein